jgi:hypothetical protein
VEPDGVAGKSVMRFAARSAVRDRRRDKIR